MSRHLLKNKNEVNIDDKKAFRELMKAKESCGNIDIQEYLKNDLSSLGKVNTFLERINEIEEEYIIDNDLKKFTLNDFLNITTQNYDNNNKNERDAVHLLTIHKAKGLEFKYVFISLINSVLSFLCRISNKEGNSTLSAFEIFTIFSIVVKLLPVSIRLTCRLSIPTSSANCSCFMPLFSLNSLTLAPKNFFDESIFKSPFL